MENNNQEAIRIFKQFLYDKTANWTLTTLDNKTLYCAIIEVRIDNEDIYDEIIQLITTFIIKYNMGEIIHNQKYRSYKEYTIISICLKFNLDITKEQLFEIFDREINELNEENVKKRLFD